MMTLRVRRLRAERRRVWGVAAAKTRRARSKKRTEPTHRQGSGQRSRTRTWTFCWRGSPDDSRVLDACVKGGAMCTLCNTIRGSQGATRSARCSKRSTWFTGTSGVSPPHKSVIKGPSSQTSRRESGPALLIYQKTKAVGPERVRPRTLGLKATRMRGQPAHTPGLQSPSSARRAGSDTTGKPADNQQWSRRMTRGVSVDVDHAPRGASLGGDVTHKMHPSGAETIV